MSAVLLEHFETLALGQGGVGKLRELIFELAIQGKLVVQNPGEGSGHDLLQMAALEKNRKGLRNSETPLSDGVAFEIPATWTWTNLGTLGIVNPRNAISDDIETAFVPMKFVPEIYGLDVEYERKPWHEIKKGFTHFAEDDVGLAKITPCFENGKSAVLRNLPNGYGAGTTELHIFRPIEQTVLPNYVWIYLKSPFFLLNGIPRMTGSAGQKRVPTEYFSGHPFPLPPLEEQRRIVAKVDELMRLCDLLEQSTTQSETTRRALLHSLLAAGAWAEVMESLPTLLQTPEDVAELRKGILELAVRGKLVEQDSREGGAYQLLKVLDDQIHRLLQDKQISKPKYESAVDPERFPFELPNTWEWVFLGKLSRQIDYGTSQKAHEVEDGVPILRMNNIEAGKVQLDNLKYVPNSLDELPHLYLEENDILFNRTNSYELVGKSGLFMGESNRYTFASYLIRVRPFKTVVCPRFMTFAMNAPFYRTTQIEPEITQQTNQANFNGTKLANTLVPLPPLPEQHRIVAKVDEILALCDQLEAALVKSNQTLTAALASAVAQAV